MLSVGRRKRTHAYAPPRLRFSHGAWYHVVKGKWTRLSDVYATVPVQRQGAPNWEALR
jgi:hypothetical protein